MTNLWNSLRFRLLLLIGLAVLPAVLLTLRSGFEQRALAAERAQESASRVARQVTRQNDLTIEGARQLLLALSSVDEIRDGDVEACSTFLQNLKQHYANYYALSVVYPDGRIFCSSLGEVPAPFINTHAVEASIEQRGFSLGRYEQKNLGFVGITFAYPVLQGNQPVERIVTASLSLDWFYEVAQQVNLPERSALVVMDSEGTILARVPEPERWVGQMLPDAELLGTALALGEGDIAEVSGVDGINRLYAFSPFFPVQEDVVFVMIGIPTEVAYQEVDRQLALSLSLLGGVSLLALLVAWVLGDRMLVGPIGVLLRATQRLERGESGARANLPSSFGEISLLAGSFDSMADTLEQREKHILEAEARYRTLVEQVPAVIYTLALDSERNLLYVSPQVEDIFGYRVQEWQQNPLIWAQGIHPYDRDQVLETLTEALRNKTAFESEYRFIAHNGVHLWIRDEALPVYDLQGEPLFLQGIMLDITERKRSEFALRTYAVQLERSNRELQDFAYIASHDLQEPLRKIQAFGERLDAKYSELLGEDGSSYLERMRSSAARMQVLINDLLSYSRVTTKANPFVPVNLRSIVDEVVSDLGTRIEDTEGTVQVGEIAPIEADPVQMRQLFQNLIGNALKFHRQGVPPVIQVTSSRLNKVNGRKSMLQICVKDNGIGFEEKFLDRIFQPFQRLHGRGEYEGSGIGLAICRKIVERHDGVLTANSTPGEGSTFIITLPVKHEDKGEEYGH